MANTGGRRTLLVALLLFCGTLALYAPTAGFDFVEYDDPSYVRDNPHIAHGLTGESVRWALSSTHYAYNWHPLTWLSHALDVQLSGLDAGRHHAVNALLHAANAVLLFGALRGLLGSFWPSAMVAALFALHPLRVESVAWISERKDVLSGTFFALTLLAYGRYARAPSPGRYLAVALAYLAGLMAKPSLVTLPCLLLLLDFTVLRPRVNAGAGPAQSPRRLLLEKLPLLALSLGSIALTLVSQQEGGAIKALPFGARATNALIAYATYLGQYVWPVDLAVFYPHPALLAPGESRLGVACLSAALLAGLSAAAWWARRAVPAFALGWCWFLGLLVPMIGLVQVGDLGHADRYAYLSALGLELAIVGSCAEIARRLPAARAPLVGGFLACLLALALRASDQVGVWKDSHTLFEHALDVTRMNYLAHNNLGLALAREQRIDEALVHFEAARDIQPRLFQAQFNVGKARARRGELAQAQEALEQAVALQPENAEAHYDLALTLFRRETPEGAERELALAARLDPELAEDARFRELRSLVDERLKKP